MHKNNRSYLIASALFLLFIIGGTAFFVFQRQNSQTLTADDITKKFDCNRITADVRETDVFCGNPKFYNNPSSITKEDYYKYYACDERLKGSPPDETAKTSDSGYYDAYYNCKDETKLERLRQDFIKELEKLKAKYS